MTQADAVVVYRLLAEIGDDMKHRALSGSADSSAVIEEFLGRLLAVKRYIEWLGRCEP